MNKYTAYYLVILMTVSLPPWGLILSPFGLVVQVIAIVIQLIGLFALMILLKH